MVSRGNYDYFNNMNSIQLFKSVCIYTVQSYGQRSPLVGSNASLLEVQTDMFILMQGLP